MTNIEGRGMGCGRGKEFPTLQIKVRYGPFLLSKWMWALHLLI